MSTQIRLGQITTTGAATNDIVKYNGTAYVPATNTPVFANITSKPTTLSGYGITDAQGLDAGLTALAGLTGAGIVSATGTDTFAMISSVPATQGGTGQTTYTVGDILYASTTSALSKLADVATGSVLISGGVGVAPSYGKINLSTHVTALTGNRAIITDSGGLIVASAVTTTEIGYLTGTTSAIQTQLNNKQTADAGLTSLAGLSGAGVVIASGTDSFAMQSALAATLGGTGWTTYAVGDILYGASTTTIGRLASIASGNVLLCNGVGVAPSFGKVNLSTHVTALTPSRATVTNASGFIIEATTTSTEIGYVNGVTSSIQTQLNNKVSAGVVTGSGITMSTARILGRTTAATGAIEEITIGSGLSLSAGSLAVGSGLTSLESLTGAGVVTATGTDTFAMVASVPATQGGTGQTTYATGDILYASSTSALSRLADVATGNVLISGGVGVAPSYGKIGLTTHVTALTASRAAATDASGFLSVANTTLTELNYVSGVTSAIQTQFTGKASTGAITSNGNTMSTARMLGRTTASTGAIEEITIGTGLSLSGGTLSSTSSVDIAIYADVLQTSNITLNTATPNIDSISINANTRVLFTGQSTQSQNGIYTNVSSTPWVRATDYNSDAVIRAGIVYIKQGSVNGLSYVTNNNTSTITVGSTSITYNNPVSYLETTYLDGVTSSIQTQLNTKGPGTISSLTGDVTASGSGAVAATLATVASAGTTGSGTLIPVITIDAKGRTTSITTATNTPSFANVTGKPTTVAGYGIKDLATTFADCASGTNIAINTNTATVDGVSISSTTRVLLYGNTNAIGNGIYTNVNSTSWVRALDYDESVEVGGTCIYIKQGSTHANKFIFNTNTTTVTVGSTNLTFSIPISYTEVSYLSGVTSAIQTQLNAKQASDTGLTSLAGLTGAGIVSATGTDAFSMISSVPATQGGTGQTIYAVGDLLYASATTSLSKLADVATGNVLISGGVGAAPSYGKIGLSTHVTGITPSRAAVTDASGFLTTSTVTLTELGYVSGVTSSIQTQFTGKASTGAVVGSGITMSTARILGRTTASTGAIEEITIGTGLSLSAGTLSSTVTGTVTSVAISGGTTGLSTSGGPITTSGTITLAGTLVAANGGTGQTTYTVGDILYASTSSALSKLADVATGNVLISGGVGAAPSYGKVALSTHVTAITASRAAVTDASGFLTTSTTTSTELGYVSGVTSAIQTQIDAVKVGASIGNTATVTITTGTAALTPGVGTAKVWYNPATTGGTVTIRLPSTSVDGTIIRMFVGGTIAVGSLACTSLSIQNSAAAAIFSSNFTNFAAYSGDVYSFIWNTDVSNWCVLS